jgi:glyoxylase-like metal-dependent hydrolase (beta-lactamase superfamily II)
VEELEVAGYALSDLHTLILTHAHGDHIGSAAELVRCSGAQVIAHREEAPYIQGEKPLPAESAGRDR